MHWVHTHVYTHIHLQTHLHTRTYISPTSYSSGSGVHTAMIIWSIIGAGRMILYTIKYNHMYIIHIVNGCRQADGPGLELF